jgi:phosphate transport system permease protein
MTAMMNDRHLKRVKRVDRWARLAVHASGLLVVSCLLAMVVLMVQVTLPLFMPAKTMLRDTQQTPVPADHVLALGLDPYLEKGWILDHQGAVHRLDLATKSWTSDPLFSGKISNATPTDQAWTVQAEDGSLWRLDWEFQPQFDAGGKRHIQMDARLDGPMEGLPAKANQIVVQEEGTTLCQWLLDDRLRIVHRSQQEDLFGDVVESSAEWFLDPGNLSAFGLDGKGSNLILALKDRLQLWDLGQAEPQLLDETTQPIREEIIALDFTFGDESILAVHRSGQASAWFLVNGKLIRVREYPSTAGKSLRISGRDKNFWVQGEREASLWNMTTARRLAKVEARQTLQALGMNETLSAAWLLDKNGELTLLELDAPHGDVSFASVWRKVWYEGYDAPEYVWQSSASTDDAEAKLSLVPLLFGSLKGTFYGLMFALPLAFGAAFYVSYLMEPKIKRWIKPLLELMAAIPSVVIGFIAALWLAPRLEGIVPTVFLSLVFLPLSFIIGSMLVRPLERRWPILGLEFLWVIPSLLLGLALAYKTGTWIEETFMGGHFKLWYFETFQGNFDYRNCLVVGLALGFTVFPNVFTIAEDALSNVPRPMTAASLALGASRWQTLRKVVLPMASPGLFAATMIGLGRAVGETMIVLMACGNTPIMDASIFNGMRTLSANIATEIPEAPVDGSLYRLLFLSGLLLFALTFLLNSLAEVVRARLKKKYAHF